VTAEPSREMEVDTPVRRIVDSMPMPRLGSVSENRWKSAQEWELSFWRREQSRTGWKAAVYPVLRPLLAAIGSPRATGDDWNLWWRDQFDEYAFLPDHLGSFIELGCGPYTNTRLILHKRTADRVVCSDPLADEYVRFRGRWLADAVKRGLVEVDNHPIEASPFPPASFDVVVMINVLDHVMDADACMQVATSLPKPGGFFLLGQDLADPETLGKYEWFDQGHPIRPTADDVGQYLQEFDPVISKTLPPRDERLQTGVFVFAGRARGRE
jgi:SAM-dependent methyltransferase